MMLYHGTTMRHLSRIKRDGLKPRANRAGNWKHTVDSNADVVYLTNAYAAYFAACAAEKDEKWLILEIDTQQLNESLLLPDEDFLAQSYKAVTKDNKLSLNQLSDMFKNDLMRYQSYWQASLEDLGTCSYLDTIPYDAIIRAVTVDPRQNLELAMSALDPSITLLNYHIMGLNYRNLMKWLFEDELETSDNPIAKALSKTPKSRVGIRQLSLR